LWPDNKKPAGHVPYWLQDRDLEVEEKHLERMRKQEEEDESWKS